MASGDSYPLPSCPQCSNPLPEFRKEFPFYPARLAVGAIIIYQPSVVTATAPVVLVLQRVLSDSFGGRWDVPGGGVEESDRDLISTCKREVFEETGLHVSKISDLVHYCQWPERRWGRWAMGKIKQSVEWILQSIGMIGESDMTRAKEGWTGKFTFLVEVEEIHGQQGPANDVGDNGDGDDHTSTGEANNPSGGTAQSPDYPIRLAEREHQAYRWVSEQDIDEAWNGERDMQFISNEQIKSIKGGFSRWKAENT